MRRLEYTLELESEGYTVMSYSGFNGAPKADSCLPIRMTVLSCHDQSGEADVAEMAKIPYGSEMDDSCFCHHYADILHGENADWVLVQFQVQGRGLRLEFLNLVTNDTEELDLDIAVKGKGSYMHLQFSVPHQKGTPDTVYKVSISYNAVIKGDSPHSTVIISEYEQYAQRTLLFENDPRNESMDDIPIRVSVTEYVDL